MNNTITNYDVYGEAYTPHLPDYVFSEQFGDRLRKVDWTIEPHVHTDLFQIFFVETGQLTSQLGARTVQLQAPCLVIIPIDTVHSCRFSEDVSGSALLFSNAYLETFFQASPLVLVALSQPQIILAEEDPFAFSSIVDLIRQVHTELYDDLPERGFAIRATLSLLLVSIYRFVQKRSVNNQAATNRHLAYFRRFQQLIKLHLPGERSIGQYAQEIGITAVHLNRVCRTVVQQSALGVIQDQLLLEAQRYLLHSAYSISEIAYQLNFEDPGYFARLFKKRLGISPSAFRANAQESAKRTLLST
ncbi:helix-turn-helix domain-containing protein [Spirosoma taeanense]|uniref:Helix-turn-helix domain-containing protein n=1 Tax=Spirosoma taeanense TaxID=2735870 RepID=A0A6M5YCF9_9BACT|nr:AraC family transcriptional regulator [Spirosoma taeanense]QJW91254.1 helix-turn-helix domain-containing protein [Spirosoma taeanense]